MLQCKRIQHRCAVQTFRRIRIKQSVDHTLSGDTYQQWHIKKSELIHPGHQFVVLIKGFTKTETGIQNNIIYSQFI